MALTDASAMEAITSNNTARVVEMLEGLEGFDLFTDAHKGLVSTVLGFASAMSYRNALDSSLAKELIERTARAVDIFPFVRLVIAATGIKTDDVIPDDVIPKDIRIALHEYKYTDKIADAIEKLNNDAFGALLTYIVTEIKLAHAKFSLPIIRRIHEGKTISEHLMFAYMEICLREAI